MLIDFVMGIPDEFYLDAATHHKITDIKLYKILDNGREKAVDFEWILFTETSPRIYFKIADIYLKGNHHLAKLTFKLTSNIWELGRKDPDLALGIKLISQPGSGQLVFRNIVNAVISANKKTGKLHMVSLTFQN